MIIEGKFKISGTSWLMVWDAAFHEWRVICKLTDKQVEDWREVAETHGTV